MIAVGTREGIVEVFNVATGELVCSCKLIDAVLAIDMNLVCNEVCVCCADAVRFFHINSNQLSQVAQVSVKAA